MEKLFNPAEQSPVALRSWTLRVLREYGFKPGKKLSQNFVVDPRLIAEIASYVIAEHTLEIGCGIGTLSLALLPLVKNLICVEIDKRLCNIARTLVDSPKFLVVHGDARKVFLNTKQVVSNLPYHITSDILVKVVRENTVERAILTVQREVAERLLAQPGIKSYGKITVLVNLVFKVKKGGLYPPKSFYPEPKVYHQVIVLERKGVYDDNMKAVEKVAKTLFTQRKRVVDKLIEGYFNVKLDELGSIGKAISGKRVMTLHPSDFYELARVLRERGIIP